MRYDKYMDDDYSYTSKKPKLNSGYVKNSKKELSGLEKEEIANKLVTDKIDNKKIFGYVNSDGLKVKFNSDAELQIKINDKGEIVSTVSCSIREYNGNKVVDYEDEI